MNKKARSKMKNTSFWLLDYLRFILPNGLSATARMPATTPNGVSMKTMRGLEKRGYARVENRIWFITSDGVDALEEVKYRHSSGNKS